MPSLVSVAGRLGTAHQPPDHFPPAVAPRIERTDDRTKLYDEDSLIATVQSNGDILFDATSFADLRAKRDAIEDSFVTHAVLPPHPDTTLYVTTATIRFEEALSKHTFTAHPFFQYSDRESGPEVTLVNEPSFYIELLGVSTLATASTREAYTIDAFIRTYERFLSTYEDAVNR